MSIAKLLKTMVLSDDSSEIEKKYDELKQLLLNIERKPIEQVKGKVKSVKKIRQTEQEYVYDIGMRNSNKPWYFGNNILIHNSCYFTAYPMIKEQVEKGKINWSKEACIELYDKIAEETNNSFPAFMERAFHCPRKNGAIIKAGRELIGDRALFITKKRYAINIFDLEGKRQDIGKLGKIKAMGLDLKRADTPKYVQNFLMEILNMTLAGYERDKIVEKIRDFKKWLGEQDSWTKGSPKSVNKLTYYHEQEIKSKTGKANMPGHVRGALNYNYLRKMNGDNYSQKIVDGMKVVVCSLKPNPLGFTSIAYPTDELRLPEWFKELPFDDVDMEEKLVDKKIENLLGVLDWQINEDIITNSSVNDLFSFG